MSACPRDETCLHGAQVGVTTCITAALYQRLLEADSIEVQAPANGQWSPHGMKGNTVSGTGHP